MTVTFTDPVHASLTYTVNGVTQTKAITPQEFGPRPACTWGAQPNLALATNYTDLWWNPSESGWGINFSHQGDIVFATWFVYDSQGQPLWLTTTLRKGAGNVFSGSVSTHTGPAFNASPWNTGATVESTVGTATVSFADGNSAAFAYTVGGVSQTKSITRQVFVSPGTVCTSSGGAQFTMAQTISDEAQRTTIAFAGLGLMTGNLAAQSFFPPGKVADYTGFQYLRDNDPDGMGHNTSFLTRVAANVIYLLSDAQFAQLKTLATAQSSQIDQYGYQRYPLMQAFRRVLDGSIPTGAHAAGRAGIRTTTAEQRTGPRRADLDRLHRLPGYGAPSIRYRLQRPAPAYPAPR